MFATNYYHRRYKFGIQRQNFGWVNFGNMTTIHQICQYFIPPIFRHVQYRIHFNIFSKLFSYATVLKL